MSTSRSKPRVSSHARARNLHGRLAVLTVDMRSWKANRREQFGSDLDVCLRARDLHRGGELPATVIYSPAEVAEEADRWRSLQRWLTARLDHRYRLDIAIEETSLPTELRWAALEAIACAQLALLENSQTCQLDLQLLASSLQRAAKSARGRGLNEPV